MYSQKRIRKLIAQSKENTTVVTLTDEQIEWVKDKVDLIENWKDTAVTKLTQLDSQIAALQTAGQNLASRVSTLETKATQFQAALTNLTARVKAIEDKLK